MLAWDFVYVLKFAPHVFKFDNPVLNGLVPPNLSEQRHL